MDPFGQVRAGEPMRLSASGVNDVLKQAAAHKRSGERPSPLLGGAPMPERFEVMVYNASDGTYNSHRDLFEEYAVVALYDPVFPPPDDNEPQKREFQQTHPLRVLRPGDAGAPRASTRFAILLEPVQPGRIGRAVFRGTTVARVVGAPTADYCAVDLNPSSSSFGKLKAGAGPIRILWKSPGSDEGFALVCLDWTRQTFAWAQFADSFLGPDSSRDCFLFDDVEGSNLISTTGTVQVGRPMFYPQDTRLLAVLNDNGKYSLVDPGDFAIAGTLSGSGSSGTIAVDGVDVPVFDIGLGTLTSGAFTVAIYVGDQYGVVAQGCSS